MRMNTRVTIDPDTMEYRVIAQDLDDEGEPFGEEFEVTQTTSEE